MGLEEGKEVNGIIYKRQKARKSDNMVSPVMIAVFILLLIGMYMVIQYASEEYGFSQWSVYIFPLTLLLCFFVAYKMRMI